MGFDNKQMFWSNSEMLSIGNHRIRGLILAALFGVFLLILVGDTGLSETFLSQPRMDQLLDEAGAWGPVLIVSLMMFAIVLSPLPSAPIAVASGALFGHTFGTVYVAIGSLAGASIAFLIARLLGAEMVRRWVGDTYLDRIERSQNMMMGAVFLLRLVPFVSFDLISYAAGLTSLQFWRFFLATLAGILPASFLLAHFGSEMASGEAEKIQWALLVFASLVAIVAAVGAYRSKSN